jgi:hypothetical protein
VKKYNTIKCQAALVPGDEMNRDTGEEVSINSFKDYLDKQADFYRIATRGGQYPCPAPGKTG